MYDLSQLAHLDTILARETNMKECGMEKKPLYIYMLVDPRNDLPFYVGRSFKPNRRIRRHISNSMQFNGTHIKNPYRQNKCCVISSLVLSGLYPSLVVLDSCNIHPSMIKDMCPMNLLEALWASLKRVDNVVDFGLWFSKQPDNLSQHIKYVKSGLETGDYTPILKMGQRRVDHECLIDLTDDRCKMQDEQMQEFAKLIGAEWLKND